MDEIAIQNLITQTIKVSLQKELLIRRASRAYDGSVKNPKNPAYGNRVTTGNLFKSIDVKFQVIEGQNPNIVISFPGAPEWYWVNYGRRGKQQNPSLKYPPLNVIRNWINVKGVFPFKDEEGRLVSKEQQAFMIRASIGEKGVFGTRFVNEAILKTEMKLRNQIGEWAAEYLRTKINDIVIMSNTQ